MVNLVRQLTIKLRFKSYHCQNIKKIHSLKDATVSGMKHIEYDSEDSSLFHESSIRRCKVSLSQRDLNMTECAIEGLFRKKKSVLKALLLSYNRLQRKKYKVKNLVVNFRCFHMTQSFVDSIISKTETFLIRYSIFLTFTRNVISLFI